MTRSRTTHTRGLRYIQQARPTHAREVAGPGSAEGTDSNAGRNVAAHSLGLFVRPLSRATTIPERERSRLCCATCCSSMSPVSIRGSAPSP
eukprot:COSAG04_NODE_3570_length_2700_cov_2.381007_3_plen_91_part_00